MGRGGTVAVGAAGAGAVKALKYYKSMPRTPGGYDALENIGKGLDGTIRGLKNKKLMGASVGAGLLGSSLTPSKK